MVKESLSYEPLRRPLSPQTRQHLAQFADKLPGMAAFLIESDALETPAEPLFTEEE